MNKDSMPFKLLEAATEIAALTEQRDRAMRVVDAFRGYANSTKGQDLNAEKAMYDALAALDAKAAAEKGM
jgi:hypothetical protein